MDSNGDLNLLGGTQAVWGAAAGSDDEPMDCDGTLTISGATVFAAGSSSMTTTPSSASQYYVCHGTSSSNGMFSIGMRSNNAFGSTYSTVAEGDIIQVLYSSEVVYSVEAVKDVNYILYSSPDMTSSSNWSIESMVSSTNSSSADTPVLYSMQSFADTFTLQSSSESQSSDTDESSVNSQEQSSTDSTSTAFASSSSTSSDSATVSGAVTVTAGSGTTKAVYKIISNTTGVYKKVQGFRQNSKGSE
ncbi:MAG: hypothetical protein LUG95_09325 [Clostridiales bacterium]|nr:hypothetical protein [Clostridiales bacterium]